MNRFLTLFLAAFVLCQLIPACAADEVFPVAHNEPIAVRVADGSSGKPLVNQHVRLVGGYDRRDLDLALWREEAVTDGEGKVRLSNTLRNLPMLRVEVLKRHNCEPGWDAAVLSVERIRLEGLSETDRCGELRAEEVPGVLTVFVKGRKGDVAGVVVQPLAIAPPPESVQAAVPHPYPNVAVSVPVKAGSSGPSETNHDAGALPPIPFALPSDFFSADASTPDSEAEAVSVPAAPRVIGRRQTMAEPMPAPNAAGSKSVPTTAASTKPAPATAATKSAKPNALRPTATLRQAVALERGRRRAARADAAVSNPDTATMRSRSERANAFDRPYSHRKPLAGRVIAPEATPIAAASIRAADAPPAHTASAPSDGPAAVHQPLTPALHSVSSPVAVPVAADPPGENEVDPMCAPEGGQS